MVDESNSRVVFQRCPRKIKSYTLLNRAEDFYTIVISDHLSPEGRLEAYEHEIDHINSGDFDRDVDVGKAELRAHGVQQEPARRERPFLDAYIERMRKRWAKKRKQLLKQIRKDQRSSFYEDPFDRYERLKADPEGR